MLQLRHARFGTFAFDLGIYDQATWLLSEGRTFITVRGLHVFAHHASPALLLYAPAYWLGAGPELLNASMVASQALGAVPVYLIARDRLPSRWMPTGLAVAYLLHPSLQFFAWESFHPDVMAMTPLLFAWWFALRRRWGWFALACVYAVSWKEDAALYVAALGIVLVVAQRRWRAGAITAAAGAAWFLFVNQWLLPTAAASDEAFYDSFFGELGSGPFEIIRNMVTNPSLVFERAFADDAVSYYSRLVAPYALVPLLAPVVLVAAFPQLLVNILSVHSFTREPGFHYSALPLTALTIAAVEGVAVLRRAALQRLAAGAVLAASLAGTIVWGLSPIGVRYDDGWWPLEEDRQAAKEAAVASVDDDERVSATYQFVPHLSHRDEIYDWPNPFVATNWGNGPGAEIPEGLGVDVLVLDVTRFADKDHELLEKLLDDDFEIVSEDQGILVARRA